MKLNKNNFQTKWNHDKYIQFEIPFIATRDYGYKILGYMINNCHIDYLLWTKITTDKYYNYIRQLNNILYYNYLNIH